MEWEESLVTGRGWELNRRHNGNGIGNGNELTGMGGNGNVASHSRTSLLEWHAVTLPRRETG